MKLTRTHSKLILALASAALLAATLPASAGTATAAKDFKQPAPEEEPWWSASLSTGYDSEYMFRGVDILDDEGLTWTQLTLGAHGFSFTAWYANALDTDYNELDLTLGYTHSFGPLDVSLGYIYYLFPQTDTDTHEAYFGVSYTGIKYVTPSLTYFYDFDLFEGHYVEFKVAGSIPVYKDIVTLGPYVSISAGDYNNSGASFGWNNVQAGVTASVAVTEHITLAGYGAYSKALDVVDDIASTNEDEFWGGASLTFSF